MLYIYIQICIFLLLFMLLLLVCLCIGRLCIIFVIRVHVIQSNTHQVIHYCLHNIFHSSMNKIVSHVFFNRLPINGLIFPPIIFSFGRIYMVYKLFSSAPMWFWHINLHFVFNFAWAVRFSLHESIWKIVAYSHKFVFLHCFCCSLLRCVVRFFFPLI